MNSNDITDKNNITESPLAEKQTITNDTNNLLEKDDIFPGLLLDEYASYFLQLNIDKLIKPLFIRKPTQFLFNDDYKYIFSIMKDYFINYMQNFTQEDHANLIDQKCQVLFNKYDNYKYLPIEWLTISNTEVRLDLIMVRSKIQLTAKSNLISTYSFYIPQDLTKTESAVEIFANSRGRFRYCHFFNADRVSVIVRNYSSVTFEHCIFENNKISVFVMDDSYAKFYNCKFKGDKNISIFVTKESRSEIEGCEFNSLRGKAIFVKDSSSVYIKDTKFINCEKGAVTIAEKSSLFLDGQIYIENPNNTAVRAINDSNVKAVDVTFNGTHGNAINIENSYGYFYNCHIENTEHPTIAVIGARSNPIFHKCSLVKNGATFCVICKNCCRPLFDSCFFSDCETNCFSCSDFSRPHIQNCQFKGIQKMYLNVFSGSRVSYENLESVDGVDVDSKIFVSPTSECRMVDLSTVENDLTNEEERIKNESNNEEEDVKEKTNVKSWRSPTYVLPPKIPDMIDPPEIKVFEPLKKLKLKVVVKSAPNTDVISFVCSKCSEKIDGDPFILTPCGHVICDTCKNDLERCPICDTPVKDTKKVLVEEECMICLSNNSNTVSLPCGHFCMCYECAAKCSENNFNCPMCNEPLSSFKFLFNDTKKSD